MNWLRPAGGTDDKRIEKEQRGSWQIKSGKSSRFQGPAD